MRKPDRGAFTVQDKRGPEKARTYHYLDDAWQSARENAWRDYLDRELKGYAPTMRHTESTLIHGPAETQEAAQ